MKKKSTAYAFAAAGLALLIAGLCLARAYGDTAGLLQTLAYLCIGLGCGVFGHGAGELISRRAMRKDPALAREREIEQNDERNIAIRDRAQAKAYSIMVPVYGALLMALALMGVDMWVTLLLVAAYLFVCGCGVYYRIQYEKEM